MKLRKCVKRKRKSDPNISPDFSMLAFNMNTETIQEPMEVNWSRALHFENTAHEMSLHILKEKNWQILAELQCITLCAVCSPSSPSLQELLIAWEFLSQTLVELVSRWKKKSVLTFKNSKNSCRLSFQFQLLLWRKTLYPIPNSYFLRKHIFTLGFQTNHHL